MFISSDTIDYIPVSSVRISEVHNSSIAGLCCSPDGIMYMLDAGRSLIYRIDLTNGDCNTIAEGKFENPVDITFFGMFIIVLVTNGLILLTPMGLLLKKYDFAFRSSPKAVCICDDTILVTAQNADIFKFIIEIK